MLLGYWLYSRYNIKGNYNMKDLNINFLLPDYITLSDLGYCKLMKLENIKALINLTTINNRLTYKQANILKKALNSYIIFIFFIITCILEFKKPLIKILSFLFNFL